MDLNALHWLSHHRNQGGRCSLSCSCPWPQRCTQGIALHEAGRSGKPQANPLVHSHSLYPPCCLFQLGWVFAQVASSSLPPAGALQQHFFSQAPGSHVSLTTEKLCCRTYKNSAWRRAGMFALSEQQPRNKNRVPLPCKAQFCTHSSSAWPQPLQHLCFCFLCGGNCGLACTACPCLPRRELPKGFSHL